MLRLVCNIILISLILALVALVPSSCTSTCQNPLHEACSEKAAQISTELAKIAVQQHKTSDEMTTAFMGACEGQLQYDLDQTLPAILAIVDAGRNDQ